MNVDITYMNISIYDQEWMGIMTPTEQNNDLQFCESCSCMTRGNPTCGKCGAWRETETMTPTEQENELRKAVWSSLASQMTHAINCTDPEHKRQESCVDFTEKNFDELMHLITADRKRVELEARLDEARYIDANIIGTPRKVNTNDAINHRIAQLKAQQEKL